MARRTRLPAICRAARSLTVPKASHHDLFTGPGFLAGAAPELRRFYAALPD